MTPHPASSPGSPTLERSDLPPTVALAQPPLRLEPASVTAAALRQINRTRVAQNLPPFPTASSAVREIGRAHKGTKPTADMLVLWADHPDERVAVALAEHPLLWTETTWVDQETVSRHTADLDTRLYDRAMGDAAREGVVWTPLLLALAQSSGWPRPTGTGGNTWRAEASRPGIYPQVALDVYADRLRPWVEQQTDPRAIDPVLALEYPFIYRVALASIRCADVTTVERVREAPAWHISKRMEALAANTTLSPEVRSRLEDEAMHWVNQAGPVINMTSVLPILDAHAVTPGAMEARLRAMAFGEPSNLAAAVELIRYASTSSADLMALMERYVFLRVDHGSALIAHPNATPALWRQLADAGSKEPVNLRQMARHPEARQDPEIRTLLIESGDWAIADRLWPHLTPEEFRQSFRRLVRRYTQRPPNMASLPSELLESLTRADWWPLLTAGQYHALGEIPSARRLPAIAEAAHRAEPALVMLKVVSDPDSAPVAERQQVLRRMIGGNAWQVLMALETDAKTGGTALLPLMTPELFATLLQNGDGVVRQRALILAAKMPTAAALLPPAPAAPAPTTAPRRATR